MPNSVSTICPCATCRMANATYNNSNNANNISFQPIESNSELWNWELISIPEEEPITELNLIEEEPEHLPYYPSRHPMQTANSLADCSYGELRSIYREIVHAWNYRPRPVFHGRVNSKLFLGMEIEINTPFGGYGNSEDKIKMIECAQSVGNTVDERIIYLKEDGSIDNGFEIVTHPMSFPWIQNNFPWEVFENLSQLGAYANRSTGLHVHVSRKGFSNPSHVFRWLAFIYKNKRNIKLLARRDSSRFASFSRLEGPSFKNAAKGGHGHYYDKNGQYVEKYCSRYVAINTTNDKTFELRMFASSLNTQEIKAAVSFAHASVEYTRKLSIRDITQNDGWTWPVFTSWINERENKYPELIKEVSRLCVC